MKIDLTGYEFVDFGCSAGGSLDFAKRHWGLSNGIGIDISPNKVEKTRALGYTAEVGDLTKPMNFQGKVAFSILSHVLEHIPSNLLARKILRTAAMISESHIIIRQPYFDCDGSLARMGLKFYWSDWPTGHTNQMTSLQLYLALKVLRDEGLLSGFSIWGNDRIASTDSNCIIPLDSAANRHQYDATTDSPKQSVDLSFECFREIFAYAAVSENVDVKTLPKPLSNQAEILLCVE